MQQIRFLRFSEVESLTGLKTRRIYQLEARGDFPRRVKISDRATGFIESEIQAWLEKRVAARDAQHAA